MLFIFVGGIQLFESSLQILTPATAEDLRMAGKMNLSPTISTDADRIKAVQVKVPVVATVKQSVEPDGKMSFIVEPPGPENEHGKQGMIFSENFIE